MKPTSKSVIHILHGLVEAAWLRGDIVADGKGAGVTMSDALRKICNSTLSELKAAQFIYHAQSEQLGREQASIRACLRLLKAREQSWKAGKRAAKKLWAKIKVSVTCDPGIVYADPGTSERMKGA